MTSSNSNPEPVRRLPEPSWEHHELYLRVRDALAALPLYFRTQTVIEGISAVDIFTLNSALGATIENQVVATLNQMRPVWDPDEKYKQFAFIRQAQTFPDVLFKSMLDSGDSQVILGIELKGWYLLAKEAEPSFRFAVTPAACAIQDIIVVVPWVLSNVISGSPMVFRPFIESASYAAEYRNYHWQHLRTAKSDCGVRLAENVTPYPRKVDKISDVPISDSGRNFGRFSRTGIMDEYLAEAKNELLAGIRAEHWLAFFKLFEDQRGNAMISAEISKLQNRIGEGKQEGDERVDAAIAILTYLESLLD